jgi:tripartite-type tricarboxylate transporter receptor subunit TctC
MSVGVTLTKKMQLARRRDAAFFSVTLLALPLSFCVCGSTLGQAYPARPVRIVVGLAAGGPTDVVVRMFGAKLGEQWGQPVVVENRTGAGGTISADLVARAPADGYTLLNCSLATHGISPALYKSLSYDPVKAFAPISLIGTTPNILVAHPGIGAKTVGEFVALAKANPGKMLYGSSGVGASPHLTMELLKSRTGIDLVHVPFKGSSLAMPEILGGRVQAMFDNLPGQVSYVQSGKLRGLGVSSLKRSPQLPDVPTIAESGLPGFEVTVWYGVCAPAATPAPVLAKIHADTLAALNAPEFRQRLADAGVDATPLATEAFRGFIAAELKKWAGVVRDAGIQPE